MNYCDSRDLRLMFPFGPRSMHLDGAHRDRAFYFAGRAAVVRHVGQGHGSRPARKTVEYFTLPHRIRSNHLN